MEALKFLSEGFALSSKRVLQKNEGDKSYRKTVILQTLFCSCLVQDSFKEDTDLAKIGPKFP
jgi:hypothetical protein